MMWLALLAHTLKELYLTGRCVVPSDGKREKKALVNAPRQTETRHASGLFTPLATCAVLPREDQREEKR